jgi:D-serine deaminase-like pyridoxal phosphate-dependent protein
MTTLSRFYQQVREARPVEAIILDDPIPLVELQTPALIIDLDVFDANLAKMQSYLDQQNIGLRAHTKMHKCPIIARKQIEGGASGVCAAKVSEAEVMCAAGIKDVLITSPIATLDKVNRFVAARRNHPGLKIVVDSVHAADLLAKVADSEGLVVDVFVDLDPGMGRTGIETGDKALQLVRHIGESSSLNFAGIQM